jgi:hypothetical protein
MRHLKVAAIGLLATVVLVSCYWMGNIGQGGLTLDLSKIQPKQPGDVVRVYLLADGKLFSTGGGLPFSAEVPLQPYPDDSRISIQGLPVGPQYQALVGIGQVSAGIFYTNYYGESGLFIVSPGADTAVTVNTVYNQYPASFTSELIGKNLKGVINTGSWTFTADESRIYVCYNAGLLQGQYDLAADPRVSSYRVNSLSNDQAGFSGYSALINSNAGILPFDYTGESWVFDPSLTSTLGGSKSILESASFVDFSEHQDIFFRRADGIGGKSSASGEWVNVDVAGVLDMVVSANNACFATEGGAFALPPVFLTPDLAAQRVSFSAPAKILSLGFIPSGADAPKIIMGTTNGVWEADVISESPSINFATAAQIPETAGDSINMIEISTSSPDNHQAYLSRYWLYIRRTTPPLVVYRLPFFAVIPGRATGMAWDSFGKLYISGTEGLSVIDVGS